MVDQEGRRKRRWRDTKKKGEGGGKLPFNAGPKGQTFEKTKCEQGRSPKERGRDCAATEGGLLGKLWGINQEGGGIKTLQTLITRGGPKRGGGTASGRFIN